jgi:hypothetical protein
MIADWKPQHAARVAAHLRRLLSAKPTPPAHDWRIEAARETGCLPIYADLGGVILVSPAGELLFRAHDSEVVVPLDTEPTPWEKAALLSMAETYPDLDDLRPVRPEDARGCPNCGEAGGMQVGRRHLGCSPCGGTGWISE